MVTARRPHVSPFSDTEFIANWHDREVHFPTITRPHPVPVLRRAVRGAHRRKLASSADRFVSSNRSLRIEDFLAIAAVASVKPDLIGAALFVPVKRVPTGALVLSPTPASSL